MKPAPAASPAAYYAVAGATLDRYRSLGPVVAGGWESAVALGDEPDSLERAVLGGARWLSWGQGPTVPGCLRVTAGTGADIATAATAALAIIETLEHAGVLVVPAVENAVGLLLYLRPATHQWGSAAALAERAPEIATVDPAAGDGRALLVGLDPGAPIPLPYSLVDGPDGITAVMPVTVDEIAAMTAGMPVDPAPEVVLGRLEAEGDLAAGLLAGSPQEGTTA